MWRRKTEDEYELGLQKKRNSLGIPLALALFTLVFSSANVLIGYRKYGVPPFKPQSWDKLISCFPSILLFSVVVFLITYLCRQWIYQPNRYTSDTVLCPACGQSKRKDGVPNCKCGGRYCDLERYTWVADSDAPSIELQELFKQCATIKDVGSVGGDYVPLPSDAVSQQHLFLNCICKQVGGEPEQLVAGFRDIAMQVIRKVASSGLQGEFTSLIVSLYDGPNAEDGTRLYRTRILKKDLSRIDEVDLEVVLLGEETRLSEIRHLLIPAKAKA